ncbi:hypothetical protein ACH40E_02780 [Streptomyces acidicola]|uniref:hypothetical protein n=1 Tax=Streptomyces acidicola TaxID=2596892 RepID=UPI0037B46A2A
MKICGRCDQSIKDNEQYTTHDILSASAGGMTVYRHVRPCRRVQIPTSPSGPQPARRYR